MIIKPNKELKQKAKYEDVEVTYFYKTSKVTLTNKHNLVESKTLREIRWITKNMMNLELIFSTAFHIQKREDPRYLKLGMSRRWPGGSNPFASISKNSRTPCSPDDLDRFEPPIKVMI